MKKGKTNNSEFAYIIVDNVAHIFYIKPTTK